MSTFNRAGTLVIFLLGATPAFGAAETETPAASAPANLPARGMTMEQVERTLGTPRQRIGAVGRPPISRWVYDGFTVYFEKRRVLHAVVDKDRGAPEETTPELP